MISLSIMIQTDFHNQSVVIKRNHSNGEKKKPKITYHKKSKPKRTRLGQNLKVRVNLKIIIAIVIAQTW